MPKNPLDLQYGLDLIRGQLAGLAGAREQIKYLESVQDVAHRELRRHERFARSVGASTAVEALRHLDAVHARHTANLGVGITADLSYYKTTAASLADLAHVEIPRDFLAVSAAAKAYSRDLALNARLTVGLGSAVLVGSAFAADRLSQNANEFLKANLPSPYEGFVDQFLAGIDFEAISDAATAGGARLRERLPADESLQSVNDLEAALRAADLAAVQQSLDKAVSAALDRAAEQGMFKAGTPIGWRVAEWFVAVLINLICAILVIHYERQIRDALGDDNRPDRVESAGAAESEAPASLLVVTASALVLRSGPSTTQTRLTTVLQGQMLRELKRKELWTQVEYIDPAKEGLSYTGWVKTKYVRPIEDLTAEMLLRALHDTRDSNR